MARMIQSVNLPRFNMASEPVKLTQQQLGEILTRLREKEKRMMQKDMFMLPKDVHEAMLRNEEDDVIDLGSMEI